MRWPSNYPLVLQTQFRMPKASPGLRSSGSLSSLVDFKTSLSGVMLTFDLYQSLCPLSPHLKNSCGPPWLYFVSLDHLLEVFCLLGVKVTFKLYQSLCLFSPQASLTNVFPFPHLEPFLWTTMVIFCFIGSFSYSFLLKKT